MTIYFDMIYLFEICFNSFTLIDFHFLFGLFSLSLSSSIAKLNYLAMFLIAGFPSNRRPRGSFPSGAMFLIFNMSSDSSFRTVNILFILATDYIFPLIRSLFLTLAWSDGNFDKSSFMIS